MTTNASLRILSAAAGMFLLNISQEAHAQSSITAVASVGSTNVELNGSGILEIADPYIKPITQYSVGLQYEKALSRHFSMITGAQYSSRGFGVREQFDITVLGIDVPLGASIETRLNYVEAPLMIKYNFTESGVTPYLKAGASAAYALNGKITPKVQAIINWSLPSININLDNDLYNRFDISAVAGAGVSIPTNTFGAINLEVGYRHSLNSMLQDNIADIGIKSHGFSAGIGYTMMF
ncbi:MAG: PorT family protein [Saprospiraceae bacterium]|nr:PorT family protein [Candidatus Opimibacter skivensis]MBL0006121.1 PorT family protein [Candidatus Opimibacter skivensis]MBP8085852.1 PorT family protein [Saprospiraceae bacterium]